MPIFSVFDGGKGGKGGGGGGKPKLAKEKAVDKIIDDLFQVLPCKTIPDMIVGINTIRRKRPADTVEGKPVNRHRVMHALNTVRSNAEYYGWTCPHVQRGRRGDEQEIGDYIAILVESGKEPYADPDQIEGVEGGAFGTLRETFNKMRNSATALELFAAYCKNAEDKRAFKRLAKDQRYIADKAADMAEEIKRRS